MSGRLRAYCQRHRDDLRWLAAHESQVQEGQRYEKVFSFFGRNRRFNVRGRPTVWEVQSVSTPFLSLPHARLVNQQDPCDIRLVSCNAIAEGSSFRLIGQPEGHQPLEAEAA